MEEAPHGEYLANVGLDPIRCRDGSLPPPSLLRFTDDVGSADPSKDEDGIPTCTIGSDPRKEERRLDATGP